MTEKNMKETWSMDDLVALTDEVQTDEIDYRGKLVKFQFCELTESEEPKFKNLGPDITEDEKMAVYQELGSERCLRMILKANEKNPDGATLGEEHWSGLPTTLRYAIANKIMGVEGAVKENFTI
jgi:hypothetical protein|tara:strand:+ start:897 stop:1268 length:372 start_codon:yes stop_codon:yes gene_type:complete